MPIIGVLLQLGQTGVVIETAHVGSPRPVIGSEIGVAYCYGVAKLVALTMHQTGYGGTPADQ